MTSSFSSNNTTNNDMLAYIYLFQPYRSNNLFNVYEPQKNTHNENIYYVKQICQPSKSICSNWPTNGTIIKKWQIANHKELELMYARVINKLRHNSKITIISTFDGKIQGCENDIITAITDNIEHNKKSKSPVLLLNSTNYNTSGHKKESNYITTTSTNSNPSSSCNMPRHTHKIHRQPLINGIVTFDNPDIFLQETHNYMSQTLKIDNMVATEFLTKLKLDSTYWECQMCFIPLITHNTITNMVDVKKALVFDAPNSNVIRGVLCNSCHYDMQELHKIITGSSFNWRDLIKAFPSSIPTGNHQHPVERIYNYYGRINDIPYSFPMDCECG